jgi:hypothetical protein
MPEAEGTNAGFLLPLPFTQGRGLGRGAISRGAQLAEPLLTLTLSPEYRGEGTGLPQSVLIYLTGFPSQVSPPSAACTFFFTPSLSGA